MSEYGFYDDGEEYNPFNDMNDSENDDPYGGDPYEAEEFDGDFGTESISPEPAPVQQQQQQGVGYKDFENLDFNPCGGTNIIDKQSDPYLF